MSKKESKIDLEQALKQLEEITATMESGNLSLEESLTLFEKGIHLSKTCEMLLKQAEQKIQILTENQGKPVLTNFTE